MIRRPSFVILLVALVGAGTAACGSGSTGGSQSVAATSSPATSAAASAPAVKVSTRTVTVTVTSSAAPGAAAMSTPTTASTPAPTASAVSLKPFVGEWVGHTRDVTVSASGRLEEHVGDGCCDPIIDLVLQLSNPRRAGSAWVATTRVVSATPQPGWKQTGQAAPEPGDRGTVTVGADHVLVDSITGNGFCDQGKTAPGTCGA